MLYTNIPTAGINHGEPGKPSPTLRIVFRDRRNPILYAIADISAKNVYLQLKLAPASIAVDHSARRRCNELEAIQDFACALMGGHITALMKKRAAQCIAIIASEKFMLISISADLMRIGWRNKLFKPSGISLWRFFRWMIDPASNIGEG